MHERRYWQIVLQNTLYAVNRSLNWAFTQRIDDTQHLRGFQIVLGLAWLVSFSAAFSHDDSF